jgi:hypothetical protein
MKGTLKFVGAVLLVIVGYDFVGRGLVEKAKAKLKPAA